MRGVCLASACTVGDVVGLIEDLAPRHLAETWDHVGLQLGNLATPLRGVALALDVDLSTVRFAIRENCNLLVTHHPLFFKPFFELLEDDARTPILKEALTKGLAIYSAHTNLDSAPGGLNDLFAHRIGLRDLESLKPHPGQPWAGLGRIGHLCEPVPLRAFCVSVKESLGAQFVRIVGDPTRKIERVAVCTGSGRDFIPLARSRGADCYVTADLHYHDAQWARDHGLALLDPGHFAMENLVVESLASRLEGSLAQRGWDVPIRGFREGVDPFMLG